MSNTFIDGENLGSIRTKLNAVATELEDKVTNKRYASTQKTSDTSDDLVVTVADTYDTIPLTFDTLLLNGFTAITSGIKYTGTTKKFVFHGVSTLGCDTLNTVVHFVLSINGTPYIASTSATKIGSTTELKVMTGVVIIELNTNDEITVEAKADKTCTISAYHTALTLVEV